MSKVLVLYYSSYGHMPFFKPNTYTQCAMRRLTMRKEKAPKMS